MRIDIMLEIKLVSTTTTTTPISEIIIAMATQIKTAITAKILPEAIENLTLSHIELDEELKSFTQSPMMNNDEPQLTPIEVNTGPKREEYPLQKKKHCQQTK